MVTIKDISKRCGVSPATVSKALNGYGDISAETAELIRKTAMEMNYRPNAAARQLKTNRSNMIGVLFIDDQQSGLAHEFFAKILEAAKREAESKGYDIAFISDRIGVDKTSYAEHCRYRKVDGVLIACINFDDGSVKELIESDIPTVTVDYSFNNQSSVVSDNISGMYELTNLLIKKGHKKIAYVHGEKRLAVTSKRLVGFHKALKEAGISIPDEYLKEGVYHETEASRKATKELMELNDPPTAILYPDDYAYIGGMNQLEKMGIRIPEDISVAGYDGLQLASVLRPALTTYRQNTEELGKQSIDKLVEAIENKKTCIPEEISIKGSIQEGKSIKQIG